MELLSNIEKKNDAIIKVKKWKDFGRLCKNAEESCKICSIEFVQDILLN